MTPRCDPGSMQAMEESLPGVARDNAIQFDKLTTAEVAFGGLIDGVNPCAFTVLVFLVAFLAHAGRTRREIALIGICYGAAVFATYFALTVHFLELLRHLRNFEPFRHVLSVLGLLFCLFLAGAHARDAWRYRRTQEAAELSLRLPAFLQRAIHAAIRGRLRTGPLVGGAVVAGVGVACFESICSGQVAVPILWAIAQDPDLASTPYHSRALRALAVYNAAFILPMALVFGATLAGLGAPRLAALAKRHVATTHLLLAVFFSWMGLVLLLLFWRDFGAALYRASWG
ncbi:MAG: hypothetical protein HYY93_01400 [Planctomycetes bacterium]|nr:hypothetical protein [Planctomycetota bacterium]